MLFPAALSLWLLALPQVLAAPNPDYGYAYGAPNFCATNSKTVSALKKVATATSYCNSYLHVTTKTAVKTSTITPSPTTKTVVVTGKARTTTVTVSVATPVATQLTAYTTTLTIALDLPAPTYTVNVTSTISASVHYEYVTVFRDATTSTTTVTSQCATAASSGVLVSKRDYGTSTIAKPTAIPTKWNASQISAACSCMSNPVPSTTTTTTKTLPAKTCTTKTTTTPTITKTSTICSTSLSLIAEQETVTVTVTSTGFIGAPFTTTDTIYEQNTVTETITTTEGPLPAEATATAYVNDGVQYSLYYHFVDEHPGPDQYPSDELKSLTPEHSGTTDSVSFVSDSNWYISLSDGYAFESPGYALVMHGYLSIQVTGSYTFTIPGDRVDNWDSLWLGQNAYTWTQASADVYGHYPGAGGSTTKDFTAGDLVPVTFVWANSNGPSTSAFTISGPAGASDDINSYLTQPCAGSPFQDTN